MTKLLNKVVFTVTGIKISTHLLRDNQPIARVKIKGIISFIGFSDMKIISDFGKRK